MLRPLVLGPIALAIAALAIEGWGSPFAPTPALAQAPSLAVDDCIEAETGETFTVAISVAGVTDLMAWDIYYAYDPRIVEVVGRDVHQVLAEEPNSSVFDLSDPVPNTNSLYRTGAADTGGPGTGEDGSGVLAVLTLRARHEGISWSSLYLHDANRDGVYDIGPMLTATGGAHIGDTDGDGIFDGAIRSGQIAVGSSCRDPAPTPYVDPGIVPVQVAIRTPAISTPSEGSQPESTPGAGRDTPTASAPPPGTPHPSLTPGARAGDRVDGDSGGPSPLLATVIGAGGGAAIIVGYLFVRSVRRPA